MLDLEGLTLTQGEFSLSATLSIEAGQKLAILGPSGGGKSTLLAAISGFLAPQSGRIRWNGQDITNTAPGDRPIAMLFQDGNLFPHLTVAQNVGLGLRPNLRLTPSEHEQISAALAQVGLENMESRKPAALSGGQQSRVALARVMLQDKPLVLLDEPFSALGPAMRADMLGQVSDMVQTSGATLLMVSHDPKDAAQICDQIIVVAEGQASPPAPTKDILNTPPEALHQYLGDR